MRLVRGPAPTASARGLFAVLVIALAAALGLAGCNSTSVDRGCGSDCATSPRGTGPGAVRLSELPAQAQQTVVLIQRGGPFPYPDHDGVVFHNREGHLPSEPDGYYHEYTVPTPGSEDRGARRIVTGEHGEYYWTGDHYASFRRIEGVS